MKKEYNILELYTLDELQSAMDKSDMYDDLLLKYQKLLNSHLRSKSMVGEENDKLREALRFYAEECDIFEGYPSDDVSEVAVGDNISVEVLGKRARQALLKEGL